MILRNPATISISGDLFAHGNPALLDLPLEALLCSARVPAATVIEAMDLAQRWRAENRTAAAYYTVRFFTAVEG